MHNQEDFPVSIFSASSPLWAALAAILFFHGTSHAAAKQGGDCQVNEVSSALSDILAQKPGVARSEKAASLAVHLFETESTCVTEKDIRTLVMMLRNDDESIRFWAAVMIGNVGHRAQDAVPALEAALAERPCEDGTMTSASAIRRALGKLGHETAERPCEMDDDLRR